MILIVDDDTDTVALMEKILSSKGYTILGVASAEETIDFCKNTTPELIFMDISLRTIEGLKTAEQLYQNPALTEIPIIAVSALAMKEIQDRVKNSVCKEYLEKPFSASKLLELVEQFLKKKG